MKNKIIISYLLSFIAIITIIGISLAYFTSDIDSNNSSSLVRTASLGNVGYVITSPGTEEKILPGWEGSGSTSVYFTSSSDYSTNYYCTIRLLPGSLQNNVYVKTTGADGQVPTMILLTEEETVISRGVLLPEKINGSTGEKHITNYTLIYKETGHNQNIEQGSTIRTQAACYSDETEGTALDVLSGTIYDLSGDPIANQAMVVFSSPTYFITDQEGKYTVRVERGEHNIYYVPDMTLGELQAQGKNVQSNELAVTKTIESVGTDKNKNIVLNINEPKRTVSVSCEHCTSDVTEKVVTRGETAMFTITADTGYDIENASVTGGCTINNGLLELTNVQEETVCEVALPEKVYTITLDNQNATSAGTQKIYEKYSINYSLEQGGNAISQITNPAKTNYVFAGYYTSTNGGGTQVIDASGTIKSANTAFTSNTTVYAYFKPVVTVSCTNCTSSPESLTVEYNETATFTISASSNYTLTGATVSGSGCSLSESTLTVSNVTTARTCTITAKTAYTYKYWNYSSYGGSVNVSSSSYPPTGALNTYNSYGSPKEWIRTTLDENGNGVKQEACLYYNNSLFCFTSNYWQGTLNKYDVSAGTKTVSKLSTDMREALGYTPSCSSGSDIAKCSFGSVYCTARYDGSVGCYDDRDDEYTYYVLVRSAGSAMATSLNK